MSISVVIPCYQAEYSVDELTYRLKAVLDELNVAYEIILVDDFSQDKTWIRIKTLTRLFPFIKGIKLSRNFGQHHAITAGIDYANNDWLIVMDCDLQDIPEEIANLYKKTNEGYDIVYARRIKRRDSFLKRLSASIYYSLFSFLSGIPYDGTIANFGIYRKKVYLEIRKMREPMRAFSPMVRWLGFSSTTIVVEHGTRLYGKSNYNWNRLFQLGLDIMISYSNRPLIFSIKLGLIISISAILFSLYNVVAYFTGWITVVGYASLISSIWLLSGIIIMILGILGLYISKIFDGIKSRPLYVIDQFVNIDPLKNS